MADQQDQLRGRNGAVWRACVAGRTQEWIADRYGIAQSTVSEILAQARAALPSEDLEEWRLRTVEMLRELHAGAVEMARGDPIRMYGDDGALIRVDHGNRLAAMDRVVTIQERMARLLGLDAPTKTEAAVTVTEITHADLELQELLREARAQIAAEEARLRGVVAGRGAGGDQV